METEKAINNAYEYIYNECLNNLISEFKNRAKNDPITNDDLTSENCPNWTTENIRKILSNELNCDYSEVSDEAIEQVQDMLESVLPGDVNDKLELN